MSSLNVRGVAQVYKVVPPGGMKHGMFPPVAIMFTSNSDGTERVDVPTVV